MTTEKQVTPERDLGLLECRGLAVLYVDPSSTITCLNHIPLSSHFPQPHPGDWPADFKPSVSA